MNVIETKRLTKFYGSSRGIENLDLTVAEGDFFGFIGPNGAGKSTTIRTLLGLISPTGGSARVFGLDIASGRREILAGTGFMPAEAMFYSGTRVRDMLRLSAGLRGRDCAKEAAALCDRLALDPDKKIDELSLGNRKKASIVCALQHRPRLYILDEPTSGLDPIIQREFFDILEERRRDGATVFFSSHILSEIQRHCCRAAIIRDGGLIACGSVEELAKARAKRVTVHGRASLEALSGVHDLSKTDDGASFLYSGDLNALMRTLAEADIRDLTVAEPDLEEIFMHYYTDGGDSK